MEKPSKSYSTALRSESRQEAATTTRPDRHALVPCPFRVLDVAHAAPGGELDARVLACLRYESDAHAGQDPRIVPIALERLGGASGAELWMSDEPVVAGTSDGIRHTSNSSVLFGWLHLAESELVTMERSVLRAYVRIDQLLNRLGYPNWLRVWNFLARINEGAGDEERYRQFSLGRHHAIALKPGFERELPAATAIGTQAEGLTICFLAGRHAAIQVENPRQVSAFRYPRQYGPRSPSFSRATLQHWRDRSVLFLSGTASVVGHATLHPGDATRQLEEILANIDALLANAARLHLGDAPASGFVPVGFSAYVRAPEYAAEVAEILQQRLRSRAPTAVLRGDICRTDLAIEIEAIYEWPESSDRPPGSR